MKQQIRVVEEFQLPNTEIILEVGDEILVERNVKKLFIVLGEHLNGDILMVPSVKYPAVFTAKEAKGIVVLNNTPNHSRYDPFVSWRAMTIKDAEKAMVGLARDAILKIIARG